MVMASQVFAGSTDSFHRGFHEGLGNEAASVVVKFGTTVVGRLFSGDLNGDGYVGCRPARGRTRVIYVERQPASVYVQPSPQVIYVQPSCGFKPICAGLRSCFVTRGSEEEAYQRQKCRAKMNWWRN
jgi:hypothetical protein